MSCCRGEDGFSFADFEPHQLRYDGKVEPRAIVCVIGDYEGSQPTETS